MKKCVWFWLWYWTQIEALIAFVLFKNWRISHYNTFTQEAMLSGQTIHIDEWETKKTHRSCTVFPVVWLCGREIRFIETSILYANLMNVSQKKHSSQILSVENYSFVSFTLLCLKMDQRPKRLQCIKANFSVW